MIIVGVTGQIGAGKSTVSTIIKNNTGALVIDADMLVKEEMQPGKKYYEEALKIFGDDILYNKKEANKWKINRSKFGKILFMDDEKREQFNKATFKYIGKRTKELIMENKDKKMIVLDFPLLYEGGFDKICNCVIGVVASEETKISRLYERNRIPREEVIRRSSVQMSDEELKEKADYIVDNSENVRYIGLVKDVVRLVHKIEKDEEEKKKA